MTTRDEDRPPAVPEKARQGGDSPSRRQYGWAERTVWTDRMLAALEMGVKGGKWLRWPNAFFGARGLFSMAGTRVSLVQSSQR